MKLIFNFRRTIVLSSIVLLININYSFGQVGISLFSYAESFHSPNESYKGEKSYGSGYNKNNFSYQNYGAAINMGITKKLIVHIGLQKTERRFDCDCIDVIMSRDIFYFVSNANPPYKIAAIDRLLQVPLSVSYIFREQNKKVFHSIGLGNTITYSLGRKNKIYDNLTYVETNFSPSFQSFIAPELYYQLDINIIKKFYLNFILGFRKEPLMSSNYAVYGKVGLSYELFK